MSQSDEYEASKRALDRLEPYEVEAVHSVVRQGMLIILALGFIAGVVAATVVNILR